MESQDQAIKTPSRVFISWLDDDELKKYGWVQLIQLNQVWAVFLLHDRRYLVPLSRILKIRCEKGVGE